VTTLRQRAWGNRGGVAPRVVEGARARGAVDGRVRELVGAFELRIPDHDEACIGRR
jgi:hypothetical protein